MKKYRFNLENLLQYRKLVEEVESQRLANMIWKYKEQENNLHQLTSERKQKKSELASRLLGLNSRFAPPRSLPSSEAKSYGKSQPMGAPSALLPLYTSYMDELSKKIESTKNEQKVLAESIEKKREDFFQARQNRKLVRELKEKDIKRYRRDLTRLEYNLLDDMVSKRKRLAQVAFLNE